MPLPLSLILVWTPGKQKQEPPLGEVLEELRAKLKWTQGELEAQREAERQRQVQVSAQFQNTFLPVSPASSQREQPAFSGVEHDCTLSGWGSQTILSDLCGQMCSRVSLVFCIAMLKASELEHNVLGHTVTRLGEDKDWVRFGKLQNSRLRGICYKYKIKYIYRTKNASLLHLSM